MDIFNSKRQRLYIYYIYNYESSFILVSSKYISQTLLDQAILDHYIYEQEVMNDPSREKEDYKPLREYLFGRFGMTDLKPDILANEYPKNACEIREEIQAKYEKSI